MSVDKLKKHLSLYFLVLIFLVASWAVLPGQFFPLHDFTHAGRIAEMTRALQDGHFPVRWVANFGYGYGMPLFQFYGPLPFYIGVVFYGLGLDVITSMKLLYLLVTAATVGGAYLLGKQFFGRSGGLITAAALTLAPYRAVNLFVRGALNETWAMACIPWILLGVIWVFQQRKNGWLLLTLSLTGLFLSHNITTMLFAPVFLIFSGGVLLSLIVSKAPQLYRRGRFRGLNFTRILWKLLGSVLLAIGLSAFYLFPAYLEKDLTLIDRTVFDSYFDYRLHFLYIRQFVTPFWGYGGSEWGPNDGLSFFLGWGQLVAAGTLAGVALHRVWQQLRRRHSQFSSGKVMVLTGMFVTALVGSLYLSLLKSQPIWERVPFMAYIQFPWRWLAIAAVFLALLLGSISWYITRRLARVYTALLLVIFLAVGSLAYFRPSGYLIDSESLYYTDPYRIRHQLSGILPDYLPADMNYPPLVIPESLIVNAAVVPETGYEILADQTHEKLVRTSFEEETLLELAVAHYPGWRIEIDNQRWERQPGAEGNVAVLMPPGNHLLTLRFLSTDVRKYSDWASLASWLFLAFLLLPKQPKTQS